jgi:hypothetical protein
MGIGGGPVKRFLLSICACGMLAAVSAPSSLGFAGNFDYVGQVKGEPGTYVGFFLELSNTGKKRVDGFTVTGIPYDCRDAPSGITAGWSFEPRMRVRSRQFEGKGDWVGLPLDPVGAVAGKLRRRGVAAGEFKLRGELGGAGTHCRTGLLEWRAEKRPF